MIEDVEITDNEFLRQFELEVGDNMARIEYALQDRKIFLTKYEMTEDMEEQGFRDIFIKAVFEEVQNIRCYFRSGSVFNLFWALRKVAPEAYFTTGLS
jgi:hypothetical protein